PGGRGRGDPRGRRPARGVRGGHGARRGRLPGADLGARRPDGTGDRGPAAGRGHGAGRGGGAAGRRAADVPPRPLERPLVRRARVRGTARGALGARDQGPLGRGGRGGAARPRAAGGHVGTDPKNLIYSVKPGTWSVERTSAS